MRIDQNTMEILSRVTIEGNKIFLTCGQLDRKQYVAVNKVLETLGGKWNRKEGAHLYAEDPTQAFEEIMLSGEIKPGYTELGIKLKKYQNKLFKYEPFIDNPLRIPVDDKRVKERHILVSKEKDVTGYRYISVDNKQSYIGNCQGCPDQCGVNL